MIINRVMKRVKYVRRNMWINSLLSLSNNSVNFIVIWCNGSTKDFGSFSTGSSPVTTTI